METLVFTTSGRLAESERPAPVRELLTPFLSLSSGADWSDSEMPVFPIVRNSPVLEANRTFFGHPQWAEEYFRSRHRGDQFRRRWQAATGSWDGRIVIDIGCGPGNIFATVGGQPKLLIGVDIARAGLEMARAVGYLPVLADAHALPFISEFADLVVLNAALHHCEDMPRVLAEAARLVGRGGRLVTDHDPQFSAWDFHGTARWGWKKRFFAFRQMRRSYHQSPEAQSSMMAAAVHHEPGEGLTPEMFHDILGPLGFAVEIYPHNHAIGEEALHGNLGRAAMKYRVAQRLSGIDPDSPQGALSLLCRATRKNEIAKSAA